MSLDCFSPETLFGQQPNRAKSPPPLAVNAPQTIGRPGSAQLATAARERFSGVGIGSDALLVPGQAPHLLLFVCCLAPAAFPGRPGGCRPGCTLPQKKNATRQTALLCFLNPRHLSAGCSSDDSGFLGTPKLVPERMQRRRPPRRACSASSCVLGRHTVPSTLVWPCCAPSRCRRPRTATHPQFSAAPQSDFPEHPVCRALRRVSTSATCEVLSEPLCFPAAWGHGESAENCGFGRGPAGIEAVRFQSGATAVCCVSRLVVTMVHR